MLNLFPIQWLALFAYFILRIVVGLVLLSMASQHIKNYRILVHTTTWPIFPHKHLPIVALIISELAIGILLILGFYTQIAALLLMALATKILIWKKRFNHSSIPNHTTLILLIGCAISLFITGAGVLAFDLPI